MAYSKTTWETGDVITAELLNHAEDGIAAASAGSSMIVDFTYADGSVTASESFADVEAALKAGTVVFGRYIYGDPVSRVALGPLGYNDGYIGGYLVHSTDTTPNIWGIVIYWPEDGGIEANNGYIAVSIPD